MWPLFLVLLLEEMIGNGEEVGDGQGKVERKEKGGTGQEREKNPETENKRASLRGKPEEMNSAFQEEEMVFPGEVCPHSLPHTAGGPVADLGEGREVLAATCGPLSVGNTHMESEPGD